MGVGLWDASNEDDKPYWLNFWQWRPIVEIIVRLEIFPLEKARRLHELWDPKAMLTQEEAKKVALVIRAKILNDLKPNEFILLDGSKSFEVDTTTPLEDLGDDIYKAYGVRKDSLESFCDYCERCGGFYVRQ